MKRLKTIFACMLMALFSIGQVWATDYTLVYTLDCATASSNGTQSAYGVNATTTMTGSGVKTFLNAAAGTTLISTDPTVSGSVYWTKGQGGGDIPADVLKIGKSSGGGSISFTIGGDDDITKVVIDGYVWKNSSSISVNSSDAQTRPDDVQTATSFTFENLTASKTIIIDVTSSAVCITSIKLYKTASGGGGCTNTVAITRGAQTNGTYSLSAESVCGDGEGGEVSVTDIVAASGYRFKEITTSASGNVNNTTKKVTGITAATTITVVFETIPTHTLNYQDGAGSHSKSSVAEGDNLITALGTPAASCDATSQTFVGWVTEEISGKTDDEPTFVAADAVVNATTAAANYYAVYAQSSASAFDGEHGGTFKIYAEIGNNKYYAGTYSSSKYSSTTDASDATDFEIAAVSDGFTIKDGNKYLTYNSSTNFGKSDDAYSWTIKSVSAGLWAIRSVNTTNRGFIYRAGSSNVFGAYSANNVDGSEYYNVKIIGEASYSNYMTTCSTATVATPEISGTDNFLTSSEITITCATDGASIYYTTDGADPTSASSLYSAPFSLNATATVKAIAIKSGANDSEIAEATFNKLPSYNSISDIFAAATSTSTQVGVTFNNWKISAVKNSQAFLTDGTYGLIMYQSNHGFVVGDALSGTVACNLVLYNGSAELTGITKTSTGLTVTSGTINPVVKTVAEAKAMTGANTGLLIKLENVTYNGSALKDAAGENEIAPYTTFYSHSWVENQKYNVTAVFQLYDNGNTATKQVLPRKAEDVETITEIATPTFSPIAGEYTEAQTVTISCATAGVTIYYTTDGTNPSSTSTEYTAAISVDEDMTIKAIAIKDEDASEIATAVYDINIPEDENVQKTWNLSTDSYVKDPEPTEDLIQWTATYVSMSNAKGTGTKVTNYIPTSQTSTRFYTNNTLTITPTGKQITTIEFIATTTGYATALANSTWTNATAAVDGSNNKKVIVTAESTGAVSALIGGTCGFTEVVVHYTDIDTSIPDAPTFSPIAGEYTEAQTVSISCTTAGVTIYYTTDGTNPSSASTEYTAAISVGEDMTIKAIAIKDDKSSSVATAAYVINLPEDPEFSKTWDLTTDSYVKDPEPTTGLIQWTATYVSMKNERTGTETAVNNYIPTAKSSTRFYNGNQLTITPNGKQITTVVFTATENSYANVLAGSTWTNATAEAVDAVVTVTATDGESPVIADITGTCGFSSVQVNYVAIDPTKPAAPTFSPASGTYTSAQSVELACATEGATIYYTTDGTNPSSASTEYTAAISVGEDMTIKAIAINNDKSSAIVTASYVINLPIVLNSMQTIYNKAVEVGSTKTAVQIVFNNWVISGVGTDDKSVYVTDGTKGFVIYGANHGFAVNDKLNGTVDCTLELYKKFAEVTGVTAESEGLTVTHDGIVNPIVANIADLGAVNTGAPIILKNVMFNGTNLTDGTNFIKPYTTFYAAAVTSLVEDLYYDITGIYVHYNDDKEISPRSSADIKEYVRTGLENGKWGTLCPAQNVNTPSGASFFTLAYIEIVGTTPSKAFFDEIGANESLEAGQPYLFIANGDAITGYLEGDVETVGKNDNGFIGVLGDGPYDFEVDNDHLYQYYIVKGNLINPCGLGGFRVPVGRAYFDMSKYEAPQNINQPAPGRRRVCLTNGSNPMPTEVENIEISDAPRKVIINGEMYIIRGEKRYDVRGQLVK